MVEALPEEHVKYMTDKIPMKRCGSLEEVAYIAGFIVSPGASFTTGFTLARRKPFCGLPSSSTIDNTSADKPGRSLSSKPWVANARSDIGSVQDRVLSRDSPENLAR